MPKKHTKPKKFIPIRLPGKGKIDPKLIRAAVKKVREERLARERKEREAVSAP